MHAYTPLVGVELAKSDTSYAAPALAKESLALSLCVLVCLCVCSCVFVINIVGSVLGKFCCDVKEKVAVSGTKVTPWEGLKSTCLLSGALNPSIPSGALHPTSL